MNALNRPKLRNSCHACASSKLKCSQDKPTCSRCAKRGLNCEYIVAKQGGRKPNNDKRKNAGSSTTVNLDDSLQLPSRSNRVGPHSSSISSNALHSPADMPTSSRANISGSLDMLEDLFSPMEQTLSGPSTDVGMEFDDIFTSPMSFSTEEMSDVNMFGSTADFFPTGMNSSSNNPESLPDAFPLPQHAVPDPDLPSLPIPNTTTQNFTSPGREAHNYEEASATGSPCSCLVQALGFMKHLIPSPFDLCMSFAEQDFVKATTAASTIQAVIARNEATIEAVGAMLKCSCSQDGYLLAVMSLIIFKVLGWYAAVARKTPSLQGGYSHASSPMVEHGQVPQLHTTVVGSYCIEGEDSARMVAQLVISELHRVRRLVEQLSSKLKVQAAKKPGGGGGGFAPPDSLDLDNEMALPLSAMMYEQLDADLRKRLRALSGEMIDRLRRL